MSTFKKIAKAALVLTVVASLSACGSKAATPGQDSRNEPIIIGNMGPLEGATSVYGVAVKNGIELAIEDVNASGKTVLGKSFKLISYDSKGDATEATNAFNKLVDEDKATIIVGGVLSGESTAVGSASQAVGIPVISPSATAIAFTETGNNVFRGCFTDPIQAQFMGKFAIEDLLAKTAAIIYDTGSDYSDGLRKNFSDTFESLGGKIVSSEGYNTGDSDFNTQLTKIAALNPDILYIPNYYGDIAMIAEQARKLGITSRFLGGDGWDGILTSVKDTASIEGSIFANHYSPDAPAAKEFHDNYVAKYNIEPNAFAYLAYDSTMLAIQAIDKAGSLEHEAIIDAMSNIEFSGILGNMKFDADRNPIRDIATVTITNGAYTTYSK